jgi:hypothetical protein
MWIRVDRGCDGRQNCFSSLICIALNLCHSENHPSSVFRLPFVTSSLGKCLCWFPSAGIRGMEKTHSTTPRQDLEFQLLMINITVGVRLVGHG